MAHMLDYNFDPYSQRTQQDNSLAPYVPHQDILPHLFFWNIISFFAHSFFMNVIYTAAVNHGQIVNYVFITLLVGRFKYHI